ncbi:MAG: DUF4266 domain-containing protein [Casimicrobiaceae bacterium]
MTRRTIAVAVAVRVAVVLALSAGLAGCAGYASPRPWEKGELARRDMQFDADALDSRFIQHVYTSKEAAGGGYGVGGGGCGCN